jgi:hypothetical protein
MAAGIATRPAEERAVGEFLDSASSAPSALLIDGAPGIGKSTLWSTARERARERDADCRACLERHDHRRRPIGRSP